MTSSSDKTKDYVTGIKDLIWPIFENKKVVTLLTVKAVIASMISYASIEVIRQAVTRIESGNQQELLVFVYWGLGLVLLDIIVTLLTVKNSRTSITHFTISIYRWIYDRYFALDHQYVESRGIGKISHLISEGVRSRSNILDRIADDIVKVTVSFIFALYYVQAFYGRGGVLISLGVVFGMSWIVIQIDHRIARIRKQRNKIFQENSRQRHKMVTSRFEVIQQGQQQKEKDIVTDLLEQIKKKSEDFAYHIVAYNSTNFISRAVEIGLYGMIGIQIILGNQDFATLTLMTVIASRLFNQIWSITDEYQIFKDSKEKIDDLFSLLHGPQILGYSSGSIYQPKGGSFDIKDMSYGYMDDQLIFDNFNLTIVAGSRVALVGPSGGGKTTLVKLIAGYLHPQSGQILVDEQALPTPQNCHSEGSLAEGRNHGVENGGSSGSFASSGGHISLQSYYPHIGYLTQEPSVFDGTVWENLTYGIAEDSLKITQKIDSDDVKFSDQSSDHIINTLSDKIDHIIKLARCEFIHEFKDGLQTEIGEKGVRLSGGQRQRLAIAKIMLKGPDIILLDEPTSALDSENEELVTQALNELFRGKTVIVIAHRLQTVKHADQILYIDGGQIIESGTHQELLDLGAKYATMVELQSGF